MMFLFKFDKLLDKAGKLLVNSTPVPYLRLPGTTFIGDDKVHHFADCVNHDSTISGQIFLQDLLDIIPGGNLNNIHSVQYCDMFTRLTPLSKSNNKGLGALRAVVVFLIPA